MTASDSFDVHANPVIWDQWMEDTLVGVQQTLDDLIAKKQLDQVWQLRTESILHSIWTNVCSQRSTASINCQTDKQRVHDPSPRSPIHMNAVSHPSDDESCFELNAEADSGHSSEVAENEPSSPSVADAQQGERDRISRLEDADSYECAHCEATFSRRDKFSRHQLSHLKSRERVLKCQLCSRVFKHRGELMNDRVRLDVDHCPHCVSGALTNHKSRCCGGRSVCNNSKPSKEAQLCRCTICNKNYANKDSLRIHKRVHIQTQCKYCPRVLTSTRNLQLHTRFHTGDFPLQCAQCGNAYAKRDSLVLHLFRHKPRTNVCTFCGRRFAWPADLRRHMAYHSNGDMPFTGTICHVKGYQPVLRAF